MEPTEVLFCGFLGSKSILPRVWGGWWLSRPLSIDDCCVRGPFFCGLQCYGTHDAVIVGDFWKIVRTPDALLNIYVFVETCGTDKSCGNSCCECSVCASCCTSVSCCFVSATSCVLFCRFSAVFTICIIDVSVFEQNKQFCASCNHPRVVIASTFVSSSGRCLNDIFLAVWLLW